MPVLLAIRRLRRRRPTATRLSRDDSRSSDTRSFRRIRRLAVFGEEVVAALVENDRHAEHFAACCPKVQ